MEHILKPLLIKSYNSHLKGIGGWCVDERSTVSLVLYILLGEVPESICLWWTGSHNLLQYSLCKAKDKHGRIFSVTILVLWNAKHKKKGKLFRIDDRLPATKARYWSIHNLYVFSVAHSGQVWMILKPLYWVLILSVGCGWVEMWILDQPCCGPTLRRLSAPPSARAPASSPWVWSRTWSQSGTGRQVSYESWTNAVFITGMYFLYTVAIQMRRVLCVWKAFWNRPYPWTSLWCFPALKVSSKWVSVVSTFYCCLPSVSLYACPFS